MCHRAFIHPAFDGRLGCSDLGATVNIPVIYRCAQQYSFLLGVSLGIVRVVQQHKIPHFQPAVWEDKHRFAPSENCALDFGHQAVTTSVIWGS